MFSDVLRDVSLVSLCAIVCVAVCFSFGVFGCRVCRRCGCLALFSGSSSSRQVVVFPGKLI